MNGLEKQFRKKIDTKVGKKNNNIKMKLLLMNKKPLERNYPFLKIPIFEKFSITTRFLALLKNRCQKS